MLEKNQLHRYVYVDLPPASNTRYFFPGEKIPIPLSDPLSFSTGSSLQYREAASGSSAIINLLLCIPAYKTNRSKIIKNPVGHVRVICLILEGQNTYLFRSFPHELFGWIIPDGRYCQYPSYVFLLNIYRCVSPLNFLSQTFF